MENINKMKKGLHKFKIEAKPNIIPMLIKYRAKIKDNNKWQYGNIFRQGHLNNNDYYMGERNI